MMVAKCVIRVLANCVIREEKLRIPKHPVSTPWDMLTTVHACAGDPVLTNGRQNLLKVSIAFLKTRNPLLILFLLIICTKLHSLPLSQVWSAYTGDRLLTLKSHTDGVTCLQFDDKVIVSGSYDKTVKLWDFSAC